MKIKILRATMCGGKRVEKGQIVEASDKDANLLIGIKKAEPTKKPEENNGGKGKQ